MTNPASGDDAARVALLPCFSCGAGINEPCDLRMAGHDRTVWLNGVPDLVAENARLRAEGVLAYQNGYDHGADKFRSALEVERQIVTAKDAEIAALRKVLADLVIVGERYADIAEKALPKFNWAASALDGPAIEALNKEPNIGLVRAVLDRAKVAK